MPEYTPLTVGSAVICVFEGSHCLAVARRDIYTQKPEPLEKKTRSRSSLEKKSGAGAGSSALLEDIKHKEIVLLLLFFR